MGIGVRFLSRLRRLPQAPPVVAEGRPRTLVTSSGLTTLRSQLETDPAFRSRWQTAINAFFETGGTWATSSANGTSADPGGILFGAFFAGVLAPGHATGVTWPAGVSRETVVSRCIASALAWAQADDDFKWKNAAEAVVLDMLYTEIDSPSRGVIAAHVAAKAQSLTYTSGHWDDQSSGGHVCKVLCALAAEDASSRFDTILLNTQKVAESREFMDFQSLGYAWKGGHPTSWSQPFMLHLLQQYGNRTVAETTGKTHYQLTHGWMLLREHVIPHPGMASPFQMKTNMLENDQRMYSTLHVACNLLWGLALLPGSVHLDLTSDIRGLDPYPLSDQDSIVASEDEYWSYWRDYWNTNNNRFQNITNYKFVQMANFSATQAEPRGHALGSLIPWLVLNVQLPATAATADTVETPLVRRWWPGTWDFTGVRSGRTTANSTDSYISYTHQRYYANSYEGNVADNGGWQLHRAGPLLIHRGSASHAPLSRKWTEAMNGTVSFIKPDLYAQFTVVNRDDFDAGGCRSGLDNKDGKEDILAEPAVEMGHITAWSADDYAVAISSDLTRSYNCDAVVRNAHAGNAAKLASFTREFIVVRRGSDGTQHEHVFTYDRIAQSEAQTAYEPWYNLCPAATADIDGDEVALTPWAPDAVPPTVPTTPGRHAWSATGPTVWNYTGSTRLVSDNTTEPVGGDHTAVGSGKVQVTWLEPATTRVKKMSGLNVTDAEAPTLNACPGIDHWNSWSQAEDAWPANSNLGKRAYVGLYTVAVAPETVTTDTRFFMVADAFAASGSAATVAALTCDAGSTAARCGASAVVIGKDGQHNTGSVDIPSGVTLVVFANLPASTAINLTNQGGLSITSPGRTTTSGGMLTVLVGGEGTLAFATGATTTDAMSHLIGIGAVTDGAATYRARTNTAATLQIEYSTESDLSSSTTSAGVATLVDDDFTGGESISGLSAATTYYYAIRVDGVRAHAAPFPTFTTCPEAGVPASFRFVPVSCMLGPYGPAFENVANEEPLFLMHMGDLVYADSNDLTLLRNGPDTATYENRTGLNSYYKPAYAPATDWSTHIVRNMWRDHSWDDHDFGSGSREDGDVAGKAVNLKVFKEYTVHHPLVNPTQGIWHSFVVGHCEFFVVDVRYQREGGKERYPTTASEITPDAASSGTSLVFSHVSGQGKQFNNAFRGYYYKNSAGVVERVLSSTWSAGTQKHTCVMKASVADIGTLTFHLRNASFLDMDLIANGQVDWFVDAINASTATFKFFVTAVPFNPTGTGWSDQWPGWDPIDQMEINYILQHVTVAPAEPVSANVVQSGLIILSGDRHLQAIDDGTNAVWPEVISSRLVQDGSNLSGSSWTNGSNTSTEGYAVIDVTPTTVTITVKRADGTVAPGVTPLTVMAV